MNDYSCVLGILLMVALFLSLYVLHKEIAIEVRTPRKEEETLTYQVAQLKRELRAVYSPYLDPLCRLCMKILKRIGLA